MSIATTLGVGSGIDTTQLVTNLVSAQREAKDTIFKAKTEKLTTQISGISQLKSGILNFSTALTSLIAGGTLTTQPTTSDANAISVAGIAGVKPSGAASQIEVKQLAAAQSVSSKAFADANTPLGTGKLTFTFGNATVDSATSTMTGFDAKALPAAISIDIDSSNNSLSGIAAAINKQATGMTATVVSDATGARLVIKGATGDAAAFTINATETAGAEGLAQLNYGPGATSGAVLNQAAGDAIVTFDGLTVRRPSNSISDLVTGATLTLKSVTTSKVVIGSSQPTSSLSAAVSDFVGAYNELLGIVAEQTDKDTGSLNGDSSVRTMMSMLAKLTSTPLVAGGSPSTLAELGVSTNRDGTLSVDTGRLNKAVAANPAAVEAMFNPTQKSSSSLVGIVSLVSATKPGTYAVTDLVAATGGKLTGSAVPTAFDMPLVLDATNNVFNVALDGKTPVAVTVPAGSYASGADFAAALNDAIQNNTSITVLASIGWDGDHLTAASKTLGSTSRIEIGAADATVSDLLGLTNATRATGTNASGKIDSVAAVSSGSLLFAASSSAAKGLTIQPLAGATSATITVDRGLLNALNDVASSLTASGGALYSANERLTKAQKDVEAQKTKLDESSAKMKANLTRQFAAMDSRVAAYKSTQSFLEQQVDAWNNSNR
ncbi:flagellar filament capping protein FliD [Sphingomonas sp. ID0503]|uniref:flagellar filament capping protein FliD n=1 Tax=Sphingomonas sp. ID0503 TaxID=3399691 RepID=UPI003AFA4E40